ncbi:AMP-binding protein [Rhodococcoides kroppenstedtii]|uniref:AMP-binding protein n=1 Tax=Rhodococcoides kroppenstedtii TaxID=293050 RepID=UPI001427AE0C|nr:3-[(3aS,4S,7aS)-7a-methyl-1,5-dioxo-octahydro-1H-inden-4-yl]propanoyl:CoA ligase [Rhodococcus kroppenstedtii]
MPEPSLSAGETTTPLLTDTIGDDFDRTVARVGSNDALIDVASGRRWTYDELRRDVDAVARGLMADGVAVGDRVAVWAPNRPEWTILQYATAKIGAVLVTVNPAYRARELQYVLTQAQVSILVAVTAHASSDYAAMIEEVRGDCPELRRVVFMDTDDWASVAQAGETVSAEELAARSAELTADDPINIQYTSGTTGFPKGATLSHRNILNNGYFVGELCHYTEQDRVCIPVPFYHCFGMVMGNLACTSHGAAMVIPGPSFDPAAVLRAVSAERCTSLYGVPTMFIAVLAALGDSAAEDESGTAAGYDLGTLRTGIMAGSPCPTEVMKQVIEVLGMTEVSIAYGMTETSPVSLQTRSDDTLEQRVSTVGRVGPHLEVKIVDPVTGETVPRGEPGELCTRGYSVMIGYWNNPEKTAEAIDDERWMHTGDIGVMDDDGYVAVTGRIKDMVIRGGENIYPREIEEFLYTHPDILDAQVVGIPDAKYGEELLACVRLRDGAANLTADDLREFCRGKLAHYKIPRYVEVLDEFPMTVTGKVRKVELRERFAR